jgi:ornithine decarboxylase
MSYLGVDFDCSSKGEIESLIRLKVSTGRILFANPNKQASHIKYCSEVGVNKLVFDNENELIRIKENHPRARVFLRIKCDCLPAKFGADREKSIKLIRVNI